MCYNVSKMLQVRRLEMDYRNRIIRDPKIFGGTAVIKGTRVPVRIILASLAEGDRIRPCTRAMFAITR